MALRIASCRSAKAYYARLIDAFSRGHPDSHTAVVMAPELVVHSEWLFQLLRRQIQVNTSALLPADTLRIRN
jgi:hypothetical protein